MILLCLPKSRTVLNKTNVLVLLESRILRTKITHTEFEIVKAVKEIKSNSSSAVTVARDHGITKEIQYSMK